LRRSTKLRSLKFLHGLTQVSSRKGSALAGCASFAGSLRCTRDPQDGGSGCSYAHFYWLFARRMHNRGALKLTSAAAVHHRAKLLIFTAGLMRPFRFVATVTILPQGILGSWCGTGDIDGLPQ
jgi:hypothetical protein